MSRLRYVIKLLVAVLTAVGRQVFHRLSRGPLVASWSWSVELRMVALRAFLVASASGGDRTDRRALEAGLDPPLPRSLRHVMTFEPATVGGIPGEWIRRNHARQHDPTILYLHGGAYLAGSPATYRRFVARLTWVTRATTFVPEYRLAPQHKFPAAVDDAEAAYLGLLETGTDQKRLIVAGDSAGGGLAGALLQRLRNGGHPQPAGAVLFSPYTDLEHTAASIHKNGATDYLPMGPAMANIFYLGDSDPRHPEASPMYGDYSGVAPMLIFAGGKEMILDDSHRLFDKAKADGADVTLRIEDDMFHVWPALLPNHQATRRTMSSVAEFVATKTGG
ncbi:MAG: alpha/beta hydrolase [Acidimicrobiia bacterium]|nr:alpha/beta hydrolase [Acidimicrobiia bacterium]